jgi:hypothetical protein
MAVSFEGGKNLQRLIDNAGKDSVDSVDVGTFSSARYDDKARTTIAYVWSIHEFGAPSRNIPERPTMRPAVLKSRGKLIRLIRKQVNPRTMNVTPRIAGMLGLALQNAMQQEIVRLQSPPNTAATIKRKGSSNPLVDTGALLGSVTYKVND